MHRYGLTILQVPEKKTTRQSRAVAKGGDGMNREQYNAIVVSLVRFVEKATGNTATPGEVAVLPEVATVLFSLGLTC